MKKIYLLFLAIFQLLLCSAQTYFYPGRIVFNSGEEITGLVKERGNSANSDECVFRKDSISAEQTFRPGEIKSFYIDSSRYYASKIIKFNQKEENYFLECLVSGQVNLWLLSSAGKEFFYLEKDGRIIEIENNQVKYFYDKDGYHIANDPLNVSVEGTKPSNQYIGVMATFFSDYPEIQSDIRKTKFKRKNLIAITKKYNDKVCTDLKCVVFEKPQKKSIINYGFNIGNAIENLGFNDNQFGASYIITGLFNCKSVNLFLYLYNSEFNPHLKYRINLGVLSYSVDAKVETTNWHATDYHFSNLSAVFEPECLYNWQRKKNNFYVKVGIPIERSIKQEATIHSRINGTRDLDWMSDVYAGFSAGCGYSRDISENTSMYFQIDYRKLYSISIGSVSSYSERYGFTPSLGISF